MGDSADDPFHALFEIFSNPVKPFKGRGRTYILEPVAGQSVFWRDEIDLLRHNVIEEARGPRSCQGAAHT